MAEEEKEPSIDEMKRLLGIPTKKSTFSLQGVSSSVNGSESAESSSKLIKSTQDKEEAPGRPSNIKTEVEEEESSSKPIKSTQNKEEAPGRPSTKTEEEEEEEEKTTSYVPPPPPPNSEDFSPARVYRLGWSREDSDEEEEPTWKEPDTLEEKRKLYRCGSDFVTMRSISPWEHYGIKNSISRAPARNIKYPVNKLLNSKVSIFSGDITRLEVDGVVNAANRSLLGGGGIDGAIHTAAGRNLLYDCRRLNGCRTGFTKVTRGFNLPAKYILHTVGPVNEDPLKLRSCYRTCLQKVIENNMKTVAFCCVATGIFGFDLQAATHIALEETRKFLELNHEKVDRIIFCVFLKIEKEMYEYFLPWYFPLFKEEEEEEEDNEKLPVLQKKKPPKKKSWWESSSDEED